MRVQIPDNLADDASILGARLGRPMDDVIRLQLTKWGQLNPCGRYVILDQAALEEIEAKLGMGVNSHTELLTRFRRLAGISFMGLDLRLSPAQLEEIDYRCVRQGKTPQQLITAIWARLVDDFFNAGGGGEAVVPIGEKAPHESAPVNGR